MLVNRDCKEAFLSQFSLNKTFLLHGGDQAGYTRSSCLMDRETCYINVEKDKWLVALLIQNKVFKPKNLTMTARRTLCHARFSFLFGLNEGGLDLSDYTGPMLALNSLKVNDTEFASLHDSKRTRQCSRDSQAGQSLRSIKRDEGGFLPKLLKDGCCIEVDFVTDKDNHEEARFYNQDCFLIGDDKSTKEEDEICYVVEFDNRAKLRLIFQNYGEAVSGEESG
uniref:Uncharacterized protein n=1 Tax=Ditylenchus dipsaci TaxID=166011 RepID=A0A915E0F9_9BILA